MFKPNSKKRSNLIDAGCLLFSLEIVYVALSILNMAALQFVFQVLNLDRFIVHTFVLKDIQSSSAPVLPDVL